MIKSPASTIYQYRDIVSEVLETMKIKKSFHRTFEDLTWEMFIQNHILECISCGHPTINSETIFNMWEYGIYRPYEGEDDLTLDEFRVTLIWSTWLTVNCSDADGEYNINLNVTW